MLSRPVLNILKYFNLWGFHFLPQARVGGKITGILIFFIQIVLCMWSSCNVLTSFLKEKSLMEFLDSLNFLLYYISCASCYWLIVYDSYTKRQLQCEFWNTCEEMFHNQSFSQLYRHIWTTLIPMICIMLGEYLVLAAALIRMNSIGSQEGVIIHCLFLSVVNHRIFFYIFHLKIISIQLNAILTELKQIQNILAVREFMENEFNEELNQRIKCIRNSLTLIHNMSDNVNVIFGISHLALILLIFHSSVTFLNFIYRLNLKKFDNYDYG